ncbi:DUF6286 domain-containing protein [Spirillospora sp. NPDC029432]|uniref:DUF6286 domain-containing protein n=1 Tax=Spirillospora sp. NPDC029432 TaxID=3154599 RepID=UPI0034548503
MTTGAGRLPGVGAPAGGSRAGGRAGGRAARRAFHSRRILPALIAALLVTAAGVLLAIEAISALAGGPARLVPYDRVTSWATGTAWKEAAALAASGVTALLGLLFLLAGLRPGRSRLVPLRGGDPRLTVAITRRGLRSAVAAAAAEAGGVTAAKAKVRGRKVKVTAETAMRDPGDLRERVEEAVRRRLDELDPLPRRGVAARIRAPKE